MKTSKERFEKWLIKQTKKFRKSKPKWATHYIIHKDGVQWLKLDNGFFFEKPKKKFKLVLVCWDVNLMSADWSKE